VCGGSRGGGRGGRRERERGRAISINSPDRNVKKFNVLYNTKLMEDEAVQFHVADRVM